MVHRQAGSSVGRKALVAAAALAILAACGSRTDAVAGATAQAATPPPSVSKTPPARRGAPLDPAKLPDGVLALGRAVIPDPGVVAQGPAMSALIPLGWRSQGGVVAPRGGCSEPYLVQWRAVSPDGRSGLGIFPTEIWQWSRYPMASPCPSRTIRSAREYLLATAQQMFPGARALDYRERPDFARPAAEQAQRTLQMAHGMGLTNMFARAEGGELLFAFQDGGTEMRGVLGVTAMFQGTNDRSPLDGSPMGGGTGSTLGTFLAYAPDGQLDFELVEASRRSIAPDPRWLEHFFRLQGRIGQANVEATRERAAIIVAGGAEATRNNIAAFRQMANASVQNSRDSVAMGERTVAASRESFPGDAAGDRMQRESIEAIRGVETYRDPTDGTQVQLDANYEHAWRVNGQDAYLLTRDPNFNPGQYGIEATQMGAVQ